MQILFCLVSCALKRQVVVLVETIFWKLVALTPLLLRIDLLTALFRS